MKQEMMGDDGVAVASAGPYANHLDLAPDRKPRKPRNQYLISQLLTGRMLFLMPKQQCQSTEGESSQQKLEQRPDAPLPAQPQV